MLGFLMEHMGTIVVSLLLLLSVAAIIINMSKKKGNRMMRGSLYVGRVFS